MIDDYLIPSRVGFNKLHVNIGDCQYVEGDYNTIYNLVNKLYRLHDLEKLYGKTITEEDTTA